MKSSLVDLEIGDLVDLGRFSPLALGVLVESTLSLSTSMLLTHTLLTLLFSTLVNSALALMALSLSLTSEPPTDSELAGVCSTIWSV